MELVIRGKYGEEMELAMQHTAALQLNASRYVTARPLVGQPQLNDSKAATSAPPHGHRQSLPTHDLLGVGRPSDVWRPAYSPANHSAADRESSIWHVGMRSIPPYAYHMQSLGFALALPR